MIPLIIIEDKGQHEGKHEQKHIWLEQHGYDLMQAPIPVGDYIIGTPEVMETIKRRGSRLKKMDLIGDIEISVDTKQGCGELYGDLVQDHERFRDECILAHKNNIRLIILIESGPDVLSMSDLEKWRDIKRESVFRARVRKIYSIPRSADFNAFVADLNSHGARIRGPLRGSDLAKKMRTMTERYGVEWQFCRPEDAGQRVIEILTGVANERAQDFTAGNELQPPF